MGFKTFGAFRRLTISTNNTNLVPVWLTTAGPLNFGYENASYTTTLVAVDPNGSPVTYDISSGQLPAGLTLNTATGVISGTLAAVVADANYNFTASATFDGVEFAYRSFSIEVRNVNIAPVWTTAAGSLGSVNEGEAFTSRVIATDPDTDVVFYSLANSTSLPSGLSMNSGGFISGNAALVGSNTTTSFDVRAADPQGAGSNRSFSISVINVPDSAPIFTVGQTLAGVEERTAWNQPVVATYATSYAITLGSLPPGTSLNTTTGYLTGTMPTVTADTQYEFEVTAYNSAGQTSRGFNVTVYNSVAVPIWSTPAGSLGTAMEGNAVNISLSATDPEGRTVTYARVGGQGLLPTGLTLFANGVIRGTLYTVNEDTTSNFTVAATSPDGSSERAFSYTTLNNEALPIWDISNGNILTDSEGYTFTQLYTPAHDTLSRSITYSVSSGTLPTGLFYSTSGYFYGSLPRVTANTTYSVEIAATNVDGSSYRDFSLTSLNVPAVPTWSTGAGELVQVNEGFGVNLSVLANGSDGIPVTYSVVSGALPGGVSLNANTGAITGTAGRVGVTTSFNFTIRATSSEGYADRAFSILVNNAASNITWVTAAGNVGNFNEKVSVSIQLEATHLDLPVEFALSNSTTLPSGLTLNANGVISGTAPPVDGAQTYNFTVAASNTDDTRYRSFNIAVADLGGGPVWTTTAGSLGTQNEKTLFTSTLVANDPGGYSTSYTVNSGTLPAGLTLMANGYVSGTLTNVVANTTSNFAVKASSIDGHVDRSFSITAIHVPEAPTWTTNASLLIADEGTSAAGTRIIATSTENATVTYSLVNSTTLPGTVTMNSAGYFSGTLPRVTANTGYNFDARATTVDGTSDRTFTINVLNVAAAPVWTSNSPIITANENTVVNARAIAAGSDGIAVTYSLVNATTFPGSLAMNSAGFITGTLPRVGVNSTVNVDIRATTVEGTADKTFGINVVNVPVNPTWVTASGSLGEYLSNTSVDVSVQATHPDLSVSYEVTSGTLPTGLSLNANTGAISGTATTVPEQTVSNFTITASNTDGSIARSFSLSIAPLLTAPVWAFPTDTLASYPGSIVAFPHVAEGSGPITYTIANGSLPNGMTLMSNGLIYGTVDYSSDTSNSIVFTMRANNSVGESDQVITYNLTPDSDANATATLYGWHNNLDVNATSVSRFQNVANARGYQTSVVRYGPGSHQVASNATVSPMVSNAGTLPLTAAFTVETWIYPTSYVANTVETIFFYGQAGSNTTNSAATLMSITPADAMGNTVTMSFAGYNVSTNVATVTPATSSGFALPLNTWHHVAATRSGTRLYMHVNGTLVSNTTTVTTSINSSGTFRVSPGVSMVVGSPLPFGGYMEDMRVTNVARYPATSITTPGSLAPRGINWSTTAYTPANQGFPINTATGFSVVATSPTASSYTLVSGTMPAGLTFNTNGVVTGTTTANASVNSVVIRGNYATNGQYVQRTYNFKVDSQTVFLSHMNSVTANTVTDVSVYGNDLRTYTNSPTIGSVGTVGSFAAGRSGFSNAYTSTATSGPALGTILPQGFNFMGAFTIEAWISWNSIGNVNATIPILALNNALQGPSLDSGSPFKWYLTGTNTPTMTGITFTHSGYTFAHSSSFTFARNTWYHIAVTRDASGNFRHFVNGSLLSGTPPVSTTAIRSTGGTSSLQIGNIGDTVSGSNLYPGIISVDEVRITNGTARYTATFTAPSAPFADNS